MATRRTTTRRRGGRKTPRAKRPQELTPTACPGERVWVLSVPFEERDAVTGARWTPTVKAYTYVAASLPEHLQPYASQPHTFERFVEDDLNGTPGPPPTEVSPKTPYPLQVDGARQIVRAAAATPRGTFLLADDPGNGKTITSILAARAIAKLRDGYRVLVVADRPATITIGHWCRSINDVGAGDVRWCVTTWDRLAKVAGYTWDVIIADESHMVRNTNTKRWKHWAKLSGWRRSTGQTPYVIHVTATPAHEPTELPYLAPMFAEAHREKRSEWVDFPQALTRHGIHLDRGKWTTEAAERKADLALVRQWMTAGPHPAMLYREAPWGQVPLHGLPVELTRAQRAAYKAEWAEFRHEMSLARKGRNVAAGRVALLRFRQKAGMIRVDSTAEWAAAQVEAGRQVAISCEFVDTAAVPLSARLEKFGLRVAAIHGGADGDPEEARLDFQTGRAPVVVFTATASLSLHAHEQLAQGAATGAPRVGIFHQPRYSGIAGRQVTGRTHRDHQVSPWYMPYGVGTAEERVARVMVERIATASETIGGDTSSLRQVAQMLGADWLPLDLLTDDGCPGPLRGRVSLGPSEQASSPVISPQR